MKTDMVRRIADGLSRLGFARHEAHAWALGGITIRYRSQDNSFLAHWTDGRMHDYSFFDLADDQQAIQDAANLLEWARHYLMVTLSSGAVEAVRQAAPAMG